MNVVLKANPEDSWINPEDPWPNPDLGLLGADQMPAPVLGDDCLPPHVMTWCRTMAAALSAPVDYVVGNLLTSASGWMGNSRRVRATPDWVEPPHLWIANVGGPSTSKTPAQRPFVEASGKLEGDNEDEWKRTLKKHERDTERAKARSDAWKREIKDAVKMHVPAPDMPADAVLPDAPIRPRVLIADATVQEVGNILGGNPRGLLQMRDELSGWLGSMDQYSGAGSDRAFYLEAWNGGAYVIDRVKHGGQPVRVPYASLAITGGLQPDKLREALTGADDGLAARFGYVWPETLPYEDLNNEHDATADKRRTLLLTAARRLHGLDWDADDRGESIPQVIPLDADGFKLLNEIRREAMAKSRAAHGLAAGWHGKTPGRVLRLALVVEHLNWSMRDEDSPPPEIVTGESVAYAGAYLDYLAAMFERVLAGLKIDATERDAAIVARLLVDEKPLKINERENYQRAGFSFLRDKETRRSVFKALSDAGLVRPSTKTGKGRKAGDWDVNPAIWEAPREPMA